jgi:hypothetical protein
MIDGEFYECVPTMSGCKARCQWLFKEYWSPQHQKVDKRGRTSALSSPAPTRPHHTFKIPQPPTTRSNYTHNYLDGLIVDRLQKIPNMADTNGASGATEDIVEKYDVLPKMIQHLDRHLIFPLLEDRDDTTENKKLKAELLKGTNMFDYLGKLDADIKGSSTPSKEYAQKRDDVIKKKDHFEEQTEKLRGLLEDEAVVSNFRSDKVANLKYLETEHGVTAEMVNALYDFGNFQYSCGEYVQAADLLYQFRVLVRFLLSLHLFRTC